MTKAELTALAERCQKATGPDRELDEATTPALALTAACLLARAEEMG